ncbi:hypothetical protein L6R52_04615 [Myxococcota bacterium]|nr:hypothetical protein [Myxococcota bacterium]
MTFASVISACAPALTYTPSPVVVPLFGRGGEAHTSLHGGSQGAQLAAAYAVSDEVMFRLVGHTQNRDDGHYRLFTGGAGYYLAQPLTRRRWLSLRGAASADFGVADVRGTAIVSNGSGGQRGDLYEGVGYRVSTQLDLGAASKYFAAGVTGRLVYFGLQHGERSAAGEDATASWWMFEPAAVLRGGLESIKLELQGGWSEPISRDGVVGDYRKWFWSLGIVAALE